MAFYSAFWGRAFWNRAFQIARNTVAPAPAPAVDGGFFPIKKSKPSKRVENETEERLKFDRVIQDIYDRIEGVAPEKKQEIVKIVTRKKEAAKQLPPIPELDVSGIMEDLKSFKRLMAIHKQMMQEEEAMVLLLAL